MSDADVISAAPVPAQDETPARRQRHLFLWKGSAMKHTIYEDPVTHKFALVRLPKGFLEGEKVPVLPTDRWFDTRDEARAALPELLIADE
jgi:hypothetical protein